MDLVLTPRIVSIRWYSRWTRMAKG